MSINEIFVRSAFWDLNFVDKIFELMSGTDKNIDLTQKSFELKLIFFLNEILRLGMRRFELFQNI